MGAPFLGVRQVEDLLPVVERRDHLEGLGHRARRVPTGDRWRRQDMAHECMPGAALGKSPRSGHEGRQKHPSPLHQIPHRLVNLDDPRVQTLRQRRLHPGALVRLLGQGLDAPGPLLLPDALED